MYHSLGFSLFLDENLTAINIGEGKRLDQLKNQYIEHIFNKKQIKHDLAFNKQSWFIKDILFLLNQILKIPINFFLSYVLNRIEFNSKYIKLKNYEFGNNSIFNENITNIKNILKRLIIKIYYNFTSKKNIDLEMLDPTGVVVEKWVLQGCFLTDVNFNDLSYSDEGMANIAATLRPDRCILVY